jgi:putative ABC transport system substrate-binding protein
MKRREFIVLIGVAAAMPFAAAQQNERIRRIGVLMPYAKDNSEGQARVAAFLQELQRLGWTEGRNLQIEYRWGTDDLRKAATELVAFSPDVILVNATQATTPMQQATKTVPIVFTQVADPVSAGFVASLARPGGNITGFTNFSYDIGAKWLELLKEIAPFVTDAKDIERTIVEFAAGSNRGLISVATPLTIEHRKLIISLAARHRLPAAYPFRFFVTDGGLIYYGPDSIDPQRQAAGYVDRILKGE